MTVFLFCGSRKTLAETAIPVPIGFENHIHPNSGLHHCLQFKMPCCPLVAKRSYCSCLLGLTYT